jgi:hypothetical protein
MRFFNESNIEMGILKRISGKIVFTIFFMISVASSELIIMSHAEASVSRSNASLEISTVNSKNKFPEIDIEVVVRGERGVSQGDLELLEDGHIVENFSIKKTDPSKESLYLVVSIDSSKSIRKEQLKKIKKSAVELVDSANEVGKIALYHFNDEVVLLKERTNTKSELANKIDDISVRGTKTLLYDAIHEGIQFFEKSEGIKKNMVIFTDGKDEGSSLSAEDIIEEAKDAGVTIYFVSVNKGITDRIKRISKLTGGYTYSIDDDLKKRLYPALGKSQSDHYILTYESMKRDNGSHTIEVRYGKKESLGKDIARFEITQPENKKFNPDMQTIFIYIVILLLCILIVIAGVVVYKKRKELVISVNQNSDDDSKIKKVSQYNPEIERPIRNNDETNKYPRGWLMQKDGPETGKKFPIYWDELTIGKDRQCGLVIDDILVSPIHARIRFVRGYYYIFDHASGNGTFLNGKKLLRPKAMHDWDEISIGRTVLLFREMQNRA